MNKPEALRLADALLKHLGGNTATQAAAELRRLHDESEMRAAAYSSACGELRKVEAQCDALLEALRRIAMASEATVCNQEWVAKTARAAIAKVEGKQ